MKRALCIGLTFLLCFGIVSCGKPDAAAVGDTSVSDNLPVLRDPDGTSTMPADKNRILPDHTEKHTDFTVDEKLVILNDLKNKEIVSVFLAVNAIGTWRSVELSAESQPEAFRTVVKFFAEPVNEYEVFEWDTSELAEYDAYVILTDAQGEQYTIFVQDYNIIHYDRQVGTFSNGNPDYAFTEAAAICFDGDWFVIRETLAWWPLTHTGAKFTGHYN